VADEEERQLRHLGEVGEPRDATEAVHVAVGQVDAPRRDAAPEDGRNRLRAPRRGTDDSDGAREEQGLDAAAELVPVVHDRRIIQHEKTIQIRWRDMDNFGHVNNAVYLTYLEEARDEWVESVLGDGRGWDFVLARVEIDYRVELTQDDGAVRARCRLAGLGTSSVRTHEELVKADGTLSAEAHAVLVARDRGTGRSRPLTADERAAFEGRLRIDG